MDKLSRRSFLKISAATFGAAAAAAGTYGVIAKGAGSNYGPGDGKVVEIPTYCDICFWKCGAIAHVKDGKLWKLTGNPKDQLSRGRLCPRGTGGVGTHYDPYRLQAPLIRQKGANRGDDKWVVVTWDEAFEFIASKLQKIKAKHGPESIALFSHGVGGKFFKHTLKAFGAYNAAAPSFAQCRGPRDVGFYLTYGHTPGSPERVDVENTKALALLGVHIGENMHNSLVQEFSHAIEKGASIIVADPRFSIAASKAKHYLPIKPGTDIALLLAWMNVLINENIYQKDFVDKHGFGFDQFKADISQYTPEWAYPITGVEPQLIRESVRELAKNAPAAVIHPGRHTTKYGDDTQRLRAIALVNALLGNWNQPGGLFTPAGMAVPGYPYPAYPPKHTLLGEASTNYPFAIEPVTTQIRDATLTGDPYPIKSWMVYSTNLIKTIPDKQKTIEAIKRLDLLVAIDILPSEITGWADVVLPESVYLERHDDLNTPKLRQPQMMLRQPVVEAPHDQKPGWWIAKRMAEKLGLSEYYPWKDIEDYLKWRVKYAGYSYKQLKEEGVILGPGKPLYEKDGLAQNFYTPSGKIEFYSSQLAAAGFDPIPKYKDHGDPPPGYFRLIFGRAPVHTFSRTQTNPLLNDMMDENEVWINFDMAKRWGLKTGQYIKLKNQDGVVSNKVKVKSTQRIRPDSVYMVHGFGHTAKRLKSAYLKGASDSALMSKYAVDPLMGGTGMNVNFVTIELEA